LLFEILLKLLHFYKKTKGILQLDKVNTAMQTAMKRYFC